MSRPDDAEVRTRQRSLAGERRRFGYRRLLILLRREGVHLNHKTLFRLYREERLTVRRPGGRKTALGTWAPMMLPQGLNERWSLDFVTDVLADGQCSSSWTTKLASASLWWPTRCSWVGGWCANSTVSSSTAADR
jgi:transposase InsO family protein